MIGLLASTQKKQAGLGTEMLCTKKFDRAVLTKSGDVKLLNEKPDK